LLNVKLSNKGNLVKSSRTHAIGCLIGLAVGDAVGTTLEFSGRDTKPPLTDMVGGGPFQLECGQWTDDTAMALALGESLEKFPFLDAHDVMTRFVAWHEQGEYSCNGRCFDIGMTIHDSLLNFKRTGQPLAGSTRPDMAGNGSLMRLAPVPIRHRHDPLMNDQVAALQSRTTHGAPEAVDACRVMAAILADAIAGKPKADLLADRRPIEGGVWAGQVGDVISGRWRDSHRDDIHGSGYVIHSLEAALWCFDRTDNYKDAVLLAANLGEDADTTAAITGQLAGAHYGLHAIPLHWRTQLAWAPRLEKVAGALFDAGELGAT
jgi:ADP-ribosyl-[dinitrogen reductase] hydrolase